MNNFEPAQDQKWWKGEMVKTLWVNNVGSYVNMKHYYDNFFF